MLSPYNPTLTPPTDGWKEDTFYLIEISKWRGDVIHQAMMFSGKLEDGEPLGTTKVYNPWYKLSYSMDFYHYLAVIKELDVDMKPPPKTILCPSKVPVNHY